MQVFIGIMIATGAIRIIGAHDAPLWGRIAAAMAFVVAIAVLIVHRRRRIRQFEQRLSSDQLAHARMEDSTNSTKATWR